MAQSISVRHFKLVTPPGRTGAWTLDARDPLTGARNGGQISRAAACECARNSRPISVRNGLRAVCSGGFTMRRPDRSCGSIYNGVGHNGGIISTRRRVGLNNTSRWFTGGWGGMGWRKRIPSSLGEPIRACDGCRCARCLYAEAKLMVGKMAGVSGKTASQIPAAVLKVDYSLFVALRCKCRDLYAQQSQAQLSDTIGKGERIEGGTVRHLVWLCHENRRPAAPPAKGRRSRARHAATS